MRSIAVGLKKNYGASRRDVEFWRIHGSKIEIEHMERGRSIIARYATKKKIDGILYSYEMSCKLLLDLFDTIAGKRL